MLNNIKKLIGEMMGTPEENLEKLAEEKQRQKDLEKIEADEKELDEEDAPGGGIEDSEESPEDVEEEPEEGENTGEPEGTKIAKEKPMTPDPKKPMTLRDIAYIFSVADPGRFVQNFKDPNYPMDEWYKQAKDIYISRISKLEDRLKECEEFHVDNSRDNFFSATEKLADVIVGYPHDRNVADYWEKVGEFEKKSQRMAQLAGVVKHKSVEYKKNTDEYEHVILAWARLNELFAGEMGKIALQTEKDVETALESNKKLVRLFEETNKRFKESEGMVKEIKERYER